MPDGPSPGPGAVSAGTPPPAPGQRRRAGRVRRWVVRPVVWLLLLLLAVAAGNILFFSSRYARASAADLLRGELSEALGREVTLRSVDFHLWTFHPTFEVQGLVIPGPHPGDPAVLRVATAGARLSWRALAQRRLDLEQVDLDRLQLYLRFNPDGTNNLPHLRRTATGPGQRLRVTIDRLLVEDGTFQLNERRARLDLTARSLWLRLSTPPPQTPGGGGRAAASGARAAPPALPGGTTGAPGAGTGDAAALDYLLTAQAVSLTLPDARPYLLSLSARGRVDGSQVRIAAAHLAGPDLALDTHGTVSWLGDNQVDLAVRAHLAARWVNRVGYMAEPIDGATDLDGGFTFRHETWGIFGTLRCPRVHVLARDFRDLQAGFRGGGTRLDVDVRHAVYAGGTLHGPVAVLIGAGPSRRGGRPVETDLAIENLELQPFLADLFPRQFGGADPAEQPLAEIAGRASGRLRFRFQSSDWRQGEGTAELSVAAAQAGLGGSRGLAVAGRLPLRMAGGVISGGAVEITAPGQEATVSGFTYGLTSGAGRLEFRLLSHDAGALAPLFPPVAPRLPTAHWHGPLETTPIWLPTHGHGTVSGTVAIDPRGYSVRFDLDLQEVTSNSLGDADRLHGTLTLEPQAVENLRLEATAGRGALMVSGRIPFVPARGGPPAEPLDLAIDAAEWPAAGLVPYLPDWMPVDGLAGAASGRVDLGGSFERLTGQADAEIGGLTLSGVTIGRLRGQLGWDPGRFTIDDGLIEDAAGRLLFHGSFDRAQGGIDLTLDAPAVDLAAAPVAGLLHAPGLAGRVALMATVGGTVDRPRATASLRGQGLSYQGRSLTGTGVAGAAGTPAVVGGAGGSGGAGGGGAAGGGQVQLVADWDGETVRAQGALGNLLQLDGGGHLDRRRAAVRLDLRSADAGGLIRLAVSDAPADLSGSLAGSLTLTADLAAATYQGELRLDDLRLAYAGRQLANREPVEVAVSPRQVMVRSLVLGEPGGPGNDLEILAGGSIGLVAPMALDLHLQSTVSAAWIKPFVPGYDIAGAADVLASLHGTLAAPELSGQAVLHDGRVVLPSLATLDGLEGTVRLYRDRVALEGLTGRLGGGTVRANGQLALPGEGRTVGYRLDLSAQGVTLRYPEGWVSRGDASLSLVGGGSTRQVQGVVRLNRALYAENLQVDPLQLLLRGLQRQRVQVAPTSGLLAATQLNVVVQGPGALRVANNVADLRGDIQLTVAGSAATPVLFGSVKLETGGTLQYSDNKYQVDHGVLTFANPNHVDPIIELALKTQVQSYEITLNLSGTLEKLNAKFSSSGDLADMDILGLLASGQRPEIGAPPPPGPQSEAASHAAASQFLAGQASSALGSRVGRLFGLDRFRLDTQTLTQAGEPTSGVVITAGKRLSKNIFVTYVSNPSSPRLDVRQIEWTVGQNITVLLTQSGTSYAVDIQRETRF